MKQKQRLVTSRRANSNGKFQKGIGVLVIVVMLAFLVGIVAVIVTRTDVQESAISGNDIRAREAHEAAQAGLEYALAWANRTPITQSMTCPGNAACPVFGPVVGTTSGESYSLTLNFTLGASNQRKVRSTATNSDGGRASVEVWIRQVSLFRDESAFPPPLIINGGLEVVLGNPVIDTGNPASRAILTSGLVTGVNTGHFNTTGSVPLGAVESIPFPSAWNLIFNVPLDQAIAAAIDAGSVYPEVPSVKTQFYYWNSPSLINSNYGSVTRPIVIIIPAPHCPDIRGGVVIYGVVYFSQACSNQGWGNADIYGSVIAEGPISKLNANTVLHGLGNATGGMGGGPIMFLNYSAPIPGTWKDWKDF